MKYLSQWPRYHEVENQKKTKMNQSKSSKLSHSHSVTEPLAKQKKEMKKVKVEYTILLQKGAYAKVKIARYLGLK